MSKKFVKNIKQVLTEARLSKLEYKTRSETPRLANRVNGVDQKKDKNGNLVDVRVPLMDSTYIGISKFGIFNFRTTSQTNEGNYWYQTLQVPDLESKVIDEIRITPDLVKDLVEYDDIKIYCDCPAFTYWGLKYMAYQYDYGIEPEDRRPERNNVDLKGANCKHIQNLTKLITSGSLYDQMSKDITNYMSYMAGDKYKNFHRPRLMGAANKKEKRINWENYDSYMNDYFASQADMNRFLDNKDVKNSLRQELKRSYRANPKMTLDEFISEEFDVDGVQGLANLLQIDVDYVKKYFKSLGVK